MACKNCERIRATVKRAGGRMADLVNAKRKGVEPEPKFDTSPLGAMATTPRGPVRFRWPAFDGSGGYLAAQLVVMMPGETIPRMISYGGYRLQGESVEEFRYRLVKGLVDAMLNEYRRG